MRIQVNLTDDMVERVDRIRKQYGVTRSALCAMFIGQQVDNTENGLRIAKTFLEDENFVKQIMNK